MPHNGADLRLTKREHFENVFLSNIFQTGNIGMVPSTHNGNTHLIYKQME